MDIGRTRRRQHGTRGRGRLLAVLLAIVVPLLAWGAAAGPADRPEIGAGGDALDALAKAGEGIFLHGVLPSGKPLRAVHANGGELAGADAACANCHRRSGLGAKEGRDDIPPITTRYLYHPRPTSNNLASLDIPYVPQMRFEREPYTPATVAHAIRDGVDSSGRALSDLMPHFRLDDADMKALLAYLKTLAERDTPGVDGTELNFATVITPDADPAKRQGMLDVLNQYFADKNAASLSPTPRLRSQHAWRFMVNSRWKLHVWQLSGPPDTWQRQLDADFARQPVLALISGIGGRNWTPVHRFCESRRVPCLFPNVEVPDVADADDYSVYFSKGVLLEADLIADGLAAPEEGKQPRIVHQFYRAGDSGEAAAKELAQALKGRGIRLVDHALKPGQSAGGAVAAVHADRRTALVLWLRPADVKRLGAAPRKAAAVFMSGLMGGLEYSPLPPAWRKVARLAYPFDLAEQRRVRVDYALGWFRIRHVRLVDEQVQADTYLACGLLAETLSKMVDTFVPEYLVERLQDMIEHRIITGYYPRLTLAIGQRFASKGGYIVSFGDSQGTRLVADGGWTTP